MDLRPVWAELSVKPWPLFALIKRRRVISNPEFMLANPQNRSEWSIPASWQICNLLKLAIFLVNSPESIAVPTEGIWHQVNYMMDAIAHNIFYEIMLFEWTVWVCAAN